jgi:hypothetical protein
VKAVGHGPALLSTAPKVRKGSRAAFRFARIILSAGRFSSVLAIDIGRVSKDRSHNALVIGENPLSVASAEEPQREGARTLGSRKD